MDGGARKRPRACTCAHCQSSTPPHPHGATRAQAASPTLTLMLLSLCCRYCSLCCRYCLYSSLITVVAMAETHHLPYLSSKSSKRAPCRARPQPLRACAALVAALCSHQLQLSPRRRRLAAFGGVPDRGGRQIPAESLDQRGHGEGGARGAGGGGGGSGAARRSSISQSGACRQSHSARPCMPHKHGGRDHSAGERP